MTFVTHKGLAVPLIRDNIDTDQIIPSREIKTVSKTGLAGGLFAGQRYNKGRIENPDFILNQSQYREATILLSGKNFGCGSSREHAVWALKEYGFRAIIAESFGEIFYNNCIRNGVLCLQLTGTQIAQLGEQVSIDLDQKTVNHIPFEISASDRAMLLEGLDIVELTMQNHAEISAYFEKDKISRLWAY